MLVDNCEWVNPKKSTFEFECLQATNQTVKCARKPTGPVTHDYKGCLKVRSSGDDHYIKAFIFVNVVDLKV